MNRNFFAAYVLLLVAQLILSNYFVFTPWITVSILPAMILCLPLSISPLMTMVIAFVTGISVDLLAEGVIGLNAFALVPVALLREFIIKLIFGPDIVSRKQNFTIKRNGLAQVSIAAGIGLLVFMIFYVWADSAGTRTFLFNLGRCAASVLTSIPLCLLAIRALSYSESR